jgi:hypothetical protein
MDGGRMKNTKSLYEEQMQKFFDLSNHTRNMVYVVYPQSKDATVDDLYNARKLADKMDDVKSFLDELLRAKNLRSNGQKDQPI